MKKLAVAVLFILSFNSCKFEEPVVFRQIDAVKIDSIRDGLVNLSAEAIFYNPNDTQGKLKDINIKVNLDDKTLATITQANVLKVRAKSELRIPIQIQFAMADVQQGLLTNLMNILSGNSINLHFVGYIKVSTVMISQKVDVDYYEKVKLQL